MICVSPGETPEGLYKGRLVTCTVVGIVRRKPPRDVLDRANPIENKATGYWQCPFCLKDDFRELSMVSEDLYLCRGFSAVWSVNYDGIFCQLANVVP